MDRDSLVSSRPDVIRINDSVVLSNTTTHLPREINWTSAQQIEAKLCSREMFDDVLGREPSTDPEPQCRDANTVSQKKLAVILNHYVFYINEVSLKISSDPEPH